MAAIRMSSNATDMIITFTANKKITGSAENKLHSIRKQISLSSQACCGAVVGIWWLANNWVRVSNTWV